MDKASRSFFGSFFLTYLVVIGINLAAFLFAYVGTHRAAEAQALDSARILLERGRDLLEARLVEIEESALRIANDADIRDFMRVEAPLPLQHYYTLIRLSGEFQRYNLKTGFVESVYLLFRNSGTVLSTFYMNPDIQWFYPNFMRNGEKSFDEWAAEIELWSGRSVLYPKSKITIGDTVSSLVTFKTPVVSSLVSGPPKAVLIALIPSESFDLYFQEFTRSGGYYSILNSQRTVIYRSSPAPSAEPATEDMATGNRRTPLEIRVAGRTDELDLHYRASVPRSYVQAQTRPLTVMFLAVVVGTILVGLVVAAFFASRSSRPLSKLFGIVAKQHWEEQSQIEYRYSWLEQSMRDLIGEKLDIEKERVRYGRIIRHGIFEQILRGGFTDEEMLRESLADAGIAFPKKALHVAVFAVPMERNRERDEGLLVFRFLEFRIPLDWNRHKTTEGDIVIFPAEEGNLRLLEKFRHELETNAGLHTRIGVGKPRESLLELKSSFQEALRTLRIWPESVHKSGIAFFQNHQDNANPYYYGSNEEQHLISTVMAGDPAGMNEVLQELRRNNFEDGHAMPSTTAVECLLNDLSSTVVKIVSAVDLEAGTIPPNYMSYLSRYTSLSDFFNRLHAVLDPVCMTQSKGKKSHNQELKERIVGCLEENYHDPQLCLAMVADRFDLNHQYLSRFFKEQVGESFSTYLETIRMSRVEELMADTSLNLKDIATMVGYLSWNSFYKAFRRRYGVSPGEYRRIRTGSSLEVPIQTDS
jgi:two-component system, response regulator YesN